MRKEMRERRKREEENLMMEMREDVRRVVKEKEFGGSYSRMVSCRFAAIY